MVDDRIKNQLPAAEKGPDRSPSRANVAQMFDRIAHRYDLLNHLLSLNQDKRWRQRLAGLLPNGDRLHLLDLATGTGDQLISLEETGRIAVGVGVDPSEGMLKVARKKLAKLKLGDRLRVQTGVAEDIPAADESYDLVTISFGIRNVLDLEKALAEMYRVLKPDGRALILEFSLPGNRLLRMFYLLYFRYCLPVLGSLISGDDQAYRYLNRTVETFPYGAEFAARLQKVGFAKVDIQPLTFGVASIYVAHKRSA